MYLKLILYDQWYNVVYSSIAQIISMYIVNDDFVSKKDIIKYHLKVSTFKRSSIRKTNEV